MSTDAKAFEGWAILELMGHRRLAGTVTEVEIAGQGFLRLDIPAVDDLPAATQFYAPGAVYALTPTTEETARAVRSRPAPVHTWEVQRPALAALPELHDDDLAELDEDDVDHEHASADGLSF